jgi:hypothetical protein
MPKGSMGFPVIGETCHWLFQVSARLRGWWDGEGGMGKCGHRGAAAHGSVAPELRGLRCVWDAPGSQGCVWRQGSRVPPV